MTSNLPQGVNAQTISLRLGHPDPATLATPAFQDAVQRVISSSQARTALAYGSEQGNTELISYLVDRINREQRLTLDEQNLTITAGSANATDMIARLYTQPGSIVLVESPSYADSLHVFRDHGVTLYGVPMDNDGIQPPELEKRLIQLASTGNPARLLYTIPNFHNPTGITTTEDRRKAVLRLAQQHNLLIVEDDVYRDLPFGTPVPPSYFALAHGAGVMQIGSVSKTLAPGLRIGWIISSADHIQRFIDCGTIQMGGGANPLTAQFVAEYCRTGHWDTHLETIRSLYQSRRDALLTALNTYMPPSITWTRPQGGFFVWLTLPAGLNATAIKAEAAQRGVLVASGENFFVNPADHPHYLLLTYSFAPLADMDKAIRILAQVIADAQP